MEIQQIVANIKEIYQTDSYMDILMDYERVLDTVHLYVYDNWIMGELVDGPRVEKHWVTCSFMWPHKMMPNPKGAKRLLDYNIHVTYKRDTLEVPVRVKRPEDYDEQTRYPKLKSTPVWIVEIKIPKPLMEDIYRGTIEVEGEKISFDDINTAYAEGMDTEGLIDEGHEEEHEI